MADSPSSDVQVRPAGAHVAEVVWSRPPNNFFDATLLRAIADAVEALDGDPSCRVVVLAPEGKHFCAGSNLAARDRSRDGDAAGEVYRQGARLFNTAKPIVAAVQGAAVGGGLGLALAADFRIVADDARLSANFSRLGYFPGFGLTLTLPRLIGAQAASRMFYTGRRVQAREAVDLGLADQIAPRDELRQACLAFAAEIAETAPLSVAALRSLMRADLQASIAGAIALESAEQARLRSTSDFVEGVKATVEHRPPCFTGT
jgi:enoyl-CoA hydratase/carnithine racemase